MLKIQIQYYLCALVLLLSLMPFVTLAEVDRFTITTALTELNQEILDYDELLIALREEEGLSINQYENILEDAADDIEDAENHFDRNRLSSALENVEEATRHIEELEYALEQIDEPDQTDSSDLSLDLGSGTLENVVIVPDFSEPTTQTIEENAKRAQLIALISILTQLIEQK